MARILVIEDNELNLKLMKDILCAQGYEVDFACDGQDGLDKAQKSEYDLILLDIQMPVVSGYDFLKTYQKQTPVIVVSCVDYISKPIQIMEFLNTVKKYV